MVQHLPRVDIFGIACPCSEPRGLMRDEFKLIQTCSFHFENIPVTHIFKQKSAWAQNHMLKRRRPERGNEPVRPHQVFSWTWREGKGTFKYSSLFFETPMHEKSISLGRVWTSQQPKVLLHWGCNIAVKKCLNARPRVGEKMAEALLVEAAGAGLLHRAAIYAPRTCEKSPAALEFSEMREEQRWTLPCIEPVTGPKRNMSLLVWESVDKLLRHRIVDAGWTLEKTYCCLGSGWFKALRRDHSRSSYCSV